MKEYWQNLLTILGGVTYPLLKIDMHTTYETIFYAALGACVAAAVKEGMGKLFERTKPKFSRRR